MNKLVNAHPSMAFACNAPKQLAERVLVSGIEVLEGYEAIASWYYHRPSNKTILDMLRMIY